MNHVNPYPAGGHDDSGASARHDAPLLPFSPHCVTGLFLRRCKRFSVAILRQGREEWIHSNNSGSMLGLLRPGTPVLASPADNPARKLAFTQEAVWSGAAPERFDDDAPPAAFDSLSSGFWTGVNTSAPNRMLAAAFAAGRLAFATGYARLQREIRYGDSRLDALLTGPRLPPLWVECKNVTMVEDETACFPDAATERGRKHLRAMMDIVRQGGRAATFYLVQRADGNCFAPADFIDPAYADLFRQALHAGVEMRPFRARVSAAGVHLEEELPLARSCF